jgi:hypothetical protein
VTVQEQPGVVLNEADHTYTIDNKPAPGVTSVIEAAGLADWTFVHEFYRDRGSRAHKAVHYMVEHDLDLASCDDDTVGYVLSAEAYLQRHNARTVSVERRVCSRTLWCAGTLDWLGLMDACDIKQCCPVPYKDKLTLLDWKTSQRFHPATAIQTIGYADMLYEETKKLIDRRLCVLLDAEGGHAHHVEYEHRNIRRDRETFRAAVLIAQWRRENKIVNLYKR